MGDLTDDLKSCHYKPTAWRSAKLLGTLALIESPSWLFFP
jgi:hypothetical protein